MSNHYHDIKEESIPVNTKKILLGKQDKTNMIDNSSIGYSRSIYKLNRSKSYAEKNSNNSSGINMTNSFSESLGDIIDENRMERPYNPEAMRFPAKTYLHNQITGQIFPQARSQSNNIDTKGGETTTEENQQKSQGPSSESSKGEIDRSEKTINEMKQDITTNRNSLIRSKHLDKKDLYNREKSKLASLIRKKYTKLMKESIKLKGTKERYVCCSSFRNVTTSVVYQFTGTVVQAIISLLAIIIYVISTYYPEYTDDLEESQLTVVAALKWAELTIAILINLDYIINLVMSKQRLKYVRNLLNILDVVIVLSVYLDFILPKFKSLAFIRVLRVVRIMRIFRFYKIIESRKKEFHSESKNEVSRRLISAILTILSIIFLATGVVHFLNGNFPELFRIAIPSMDTLVCQSGNSFNFTEMNPSREGLNLTLQCAEGDTLVKKRGDLTFDLAFYYMVITMATVGYGDIYPDTSWMRLVIGIFVIISIITITKQTSELNDLIKLNSEYQVPYEVSKGVKHCVLSGFYSKASLIKFLNEFYHPDHKSSSEDTRIVIIQSEYPDKEIQSILINPKFEENLHFIIGDIFTDNTLQIAKVQQASGIFLISDQNHPEAMKNDQFLILACKAISQYSQAQLYVQFNYSQSLLHDWADWDTACSIQQIKMSIIVKNGLISGFATMIMNLASSSSNIYNSEISEIPWMLEYIHGASQEIYIVHIPGDYNRERNFSKFAEASYINTGSLVMGVKKKVYYQEDKDIFYFIFLLNPIEYELQNEDELIVISSDKEEAMTIFVDDQSLNTKKRKTKIYPELRKVVQSDNERLFKNFNLEFLRQFKDETLEIKEDLIENEKEDVSVNNRSRLKQKIPKIFRKRQHFKIWENNPEEFSHELNSHYLIFCKEEHLWEFMNCFEQFYSDVILFVSDQHPSPKWDILRRYFKNLVYIECSYSDQEDLVKLNLEKAKHAFILTYAVENSNVNDSGILPLVKIIEENFPKCKYTLELSDELNVRYLNNKGLDQEGRAVSEGPEIEANEVGDPGISNQNHDVNKKKKVKKNSPENVARLPVRLWPKYAKSDIFFAASLESLVAFSYHNEGVLDVLTKILGFNTNVIRDKHVLENSNLTMYRYVGNKKISYKKVVNNFFMLSPPVIPIAVYRMNCDRELKNESPYIITNPKKDLELNFNDKVICIGRPDEKVFETYRETEFQEQDSEVSFREEGDKDNLEKDSKKKHFGSNYFPKRSNADDLDNLDEDQLLELLKNEIKNLKQLTRTNSNQPKIPSFGNLAGDIKLNTNHLNVQNKSSNFNIIEEKIEETDERMYTNSDWVAEDSNISFNNSRDGNKFMLSNIPSKDKSSKHRTNRSKLEYSPHNDKIANLNVQQEIDYDYSTYRSENNALLSEVRNKSKKVKNQKIDSNSGSESEDENQSSDLIEAADGINTKKIINHTDKYNFKVKPGNNFMGNDETNQSTYPRLSIAAVEGFDINKTVNK